MERGFLSTLDQVNLQTKPNYHPPRFPQTITTKILPRNENKGEITEIIFTKLCLYININFYKDMISTFRKVVTLFDTITSSIAQK